MLRQCCHLLKPYPLPRRHRMLLKLPIIMVRIIHTRVGRPPATRGHIIIPDMNRTFPVLCCVALTAGCVIAQSSGASSAPPTASTQASDKVPVMDGAAGPCSLELIVTTAAGKPAYAATVKVHIDYGFGGFHKLDLEAGTNSDGKVKFTGLPARVHRPPLDFHASKDAFEGVASVDPSAECQAKHNITLQKSKE